MPDLPSWIDWNRKTPPMRDAKKGDVWIVDMGMIAKVRPCLLLTDFPEDDELALITVVAHTTALRQNRWELSISKPFLKLGAFHFQQIQSISVAKLERKLGTLDDAEWQSVQTMLMKRLSISANANSA